jgi:hypothetical protein
MPEISSESWNRLLNGAKHQGRIYQGDARLFSIHGLYGYPARFSPFFVQSALKAMAHSHSSVLDPFMGSGTTLLESLKLGHHPTGIDLSPISNFIVERLIRGTSNTTLKKTEDAVLILLDAVQAEIQLPAQQEGLWPAEHENDPEFRELFRVLETFVTMANQLRGETAKLLQMIALSAGQWAIDGRREPVSPERLIERMRLLGSTVPRLIAFWNQSLNETWGGSEWRSEVKLFKGDTSDQLLNIASESNQRFDLAISSPPYVGVHVLYAKWQLRGRKETHLPAFILGASPKPESFLTMGTRKGGEAEYFERMGRVAEGLSLVMKPGSALVQLVGFNKSTTQLPKYIELFEVHGFSRILPPNVEQTDLSRDVPSRKWHANHMGELDTKKEHLLVFGKPD